MVDFSRKMSANYALKRLSHHSKLGYLNLKQVVLFVLFFEVNKDIRDKTRKMFFEVTIVAATFNCRPEHINVGVPRM